MNALTSISFLIVSNLFMTIAWYGHLRFADAPWFRSTSVFLVILMSWGLAFFEYCFQVPANRIGYVENGGPFSLIQLKVIQEVISLGVFTLFTLLVFKHESFRWNHAAAAVLLVAAVYLVFKD